ncbi:MAG: IS1595 family transposase [Rikenellaceae bacterium]|nr:IS1595 family transposase [Rikenellaceae bacterium]
MKEVMQIKTHADFRKFFGSEEKCYEYLEAKRFKNGVKCLHCGNNEKIYKCAGHRWKCSKCTKSFSAKTKTCMEFSKIPLTTWFEVIWIVTNNKKGVSSIWLSGETGLSQRTCWFLLKRIQKVMGVENRKVLRGDIEVDETYIYSPNKNKHSSRKIPHNKGRSLIGRTPIFVMVERGGNAFARTVESVESDSLIPYIKKFSEKDCSIFSDEWIAYQPLSKLGYDHEIVRHGIKEYVSGKATTNTAESFNYQIKRAINTQHWISFKHSQLLCNSVVFRYNARKMSFTERFDHLFNDLEDSQIKYKDLIYGRRRNFAIEPVCS